MKFLILFLINTKMMAISLSGGLCFCFFWQTYNVIFYLALRSNNQLLGITLSLLLLHNVILSPSVLGNRKCYKIVINNYMIGSLRRWEATALWPHWRHWRRRHSQVPPIPAWLYRLPVWTWLSVSLPVSRRRRRRRRGGSKKGRFNQPRCVLWQDSPWQLSQALSSLLLPRLLFWVHENGWYLERIEERELVLRVYYVVSQATPPIKIWLLYLFRIRRKIIGGLVTAIQESGGR